MSHAHFIIYGCMLMGISRGGRFACPGPTANSALTVPENDSDVPLMRGFIEIGFG